MLEAMSTRPARETQLRNREGGRADSVGGGCVHELRVAEVLEQPFAPLLQHVHDALGVFIS